MGVIESASAVPAAEFERVVATSCAEDPELLAECQRLIESDRADGPIPREPPSLDESVPHASVGERCGPYELIEPFDRGRSSILWIARRVDTSGVGRERLVALKIASVPSTSQESTARFRIESEALFQLDHPCIARVFDTGARPTSSGITTWIAMEFIRGDWITRVASEHALSWRERVRLIRQACDAIIHAHQRGVIHRDLKPSNILLAGPPWSVKVIDFGVARVRPLGSDHTLTLGDVIVGTIEYAAPEQLRGERADARADVYGLGAVLYEMLAGRPPIEVDDSDEVLAKLNFALRAEPAWLGTTRPELPKALVAVVHKSLRKEPEGRYATVSELAADLDAALAGLPVQARSPSVAEQARAIWRVRPRLTAGILASAIALAVGLAATGTALQRARRAEAGLRAEREQHQGLVAFLTDEATDRMSDLPGTLEARREMFEDFERRLAPLAAQGAKGTGDPAITRAYAKVLSGLGSQAGAEGNTVASAGYFRRSYELLSGLAAQRRNDLDLQAALSTAMVQIGDAERMNRHEELARQWHERAKALDESLHAAQPEDRALADNLARSYIRAAYAHVLDGHVADAIATAEQARPLVATLERVSPGHRHTLHARAEFECFLAEYLLKAGRQQDAHAAAMRALAPAREYWLRHPASKHALFAVSLAVNMAIATGEQPAGNDLIDEGVRIAEAMSSASRADPSDEGLSWTVAVGRRNSISALVRAGRTRDAAAFVSREIERYRIHSATDTTSMRRLAECAIELSHADFAEVAGALALSREIGEELLSLANRGSTNRHGEARVLGAVVIGFTSSPARCDAVIPLMGDRDAIGTSPPGLAWWATSLLYDYAGRPEESAAAFQRAKLLGASESINWLSLREQPGSGIGGAGRAGDTRP